MENPTKKEKIKEEVKRESKDEANLKKIEKLAQEIDTYINNVEKINDGTLKVKDLKFEMVKYDELFTQKLCTLDLITGNEEVTAKRREQIKRIFECIKIIDKIKSNL